MCLVLYWPYLPYSLGWILNNVIYQADDSLFCLFTYSTAPTYSTSRQIGTVPVIVGDLGRAASHWQGCEAGRHTNRIRTHERSSKCMDRTRRAILGN
ncbi:hypothetical protein BDW75DRAFT_210880 [Aspergillus navahoensis]